jgi:alpha-methylacyl-CoA racemase
MESDMANPPLHGIRVVEFAGIGPGPFAGMMLADHGAEVIRIDRPSKGGGIGIDSKDPLLRSRKSIGMDLKSPDAIAAVRKIVRGADAIIEGFRPGVMERLGLGPDVLLAENSRLVYGRMTGWGQTGPMAPEPGHDINYIAISGALHAFGRKGEKPTPPINMVGDFGGGGMFLAFGMLAALLHAKTTGEGQVVDAAMTDGSAVLMTMMWGFRGMGRWSDERGTNLLDTAAHFYDTYETADAKFISLGAIEPQFYAEFRQVMGLTDDKWSAQMDPRQWGALKDELTALFRTKTRDEWTAAFKGHDVCFAPVLPFDEAYDDPHNQARQTFVTAGGCKQPAPAPRYSASPTVAPQMPGERADATVLRDLGFDDAEVAALGY